MSREDTQNNPIHKNVSIAVSSAALTGSYAGSLLFGVNLSGGSAAASLIIYDNTSASGTILFQAAAPANGNAFCDMTYLGPLKCTLGLFAVLTGAGSTAQIWFD